MDRELELPLYMDHNATTPVEAGVFEAMRPYFCRTFGNAASANHGFGRSAAAAVERAREQAAALIGCEPGEIVWTSGATEADNLALKGAAACYREQHPGARGHLVTQTTEHKAVIDACKRLAGQGFDVTWLQVGAGGRIDLDDLRRALRPDTLMVSIMWVNNETGVVQPVREIGRMCRERGVAFHTDATQAVGKTPVDVRADGVDLLSFTGHKMYGPKGAGALYVRRKDARVRLVPLFDGGGHEGGFRSGTINVPGVVGVGAACELARRDMAAESARCAALRDRLQGGIQRQVEGVKVNGDEAHRLGHVANLSFAGLDGDAAMRALDDIALSSGSACSSASRQASYVLRAMGLGDEWVLGTLRYSLGRLNDEAQVDHAIRRTVEVVRRLRADAGD